MFNLFKSFRKGNDAVVLMYHRIADLVVDPWQLAVTPANFEEQLNVFSKKYRVIGIEELIHQQKHGKIKSKTVCLTFDDGYLDNYLNAKPLLEQYNCPATFFIPPYYLDSQQAFWWDELLTLILLSPKLPEIINVRDGNHVFTKRVTERTANARQSEQLKSWVWNQPYPAERCEIYMALWSFLQPLSINQIDDCLQQLTTSISNPAKVSAADKAMSMAQLKNLASNPLFTVGIHTMTHTALAYHSKAEQQNELLTCKTILEEQLNKSINIAAYPYGNFNDETVHVMAENYLSAGFTTQAQTVTEHSDIFRLGRFQVSKSKLSKF